MSNRTLIGLMVAGFCSSWLLTLAVRQEVLTILIHLIYKGL